MGDNSPNPHPVNATLTRHQYNVMKAWSEGKFDRDWPPARRVTKEITPDGLDRAALEPCVGAAFYPGIETSFHIRDKFKYVEPFRLDHKSVNPGEVTQQMSLPWQTDFVDCSDGDLPLVWWPAQRPIDVRLQPGRDPVRWARNFRSNKEDVGSEEMVRDWWRFGLLKRSKGGVIEAHRVQKILFAAPRMKSKPRRPCP